MGVYEEYLNYFLSKEERPSFQLMDGVGKVMVSAPHSVEQTRNGRIKYGEFQTGVLARVLHDTLNCPVIFKTYNCGDDANYDEVSPYKEALCEYVDQHRIGFLLDLHQLAPWRKENVDIGTGFGNNISGFPEALPIVYNRFLLKNISELTVDHPFDASFPYTVSAYVSSKCGIPCIQIELNTRLLCEDYEDYCLPIIQDALQEIIQELNAVGEKGK